MVTKIKQPKTYKLLCILGFIFLHTGINAQKISHPLSGFKLVNDPLTLSFKPDWLISPAKPSSIYLFQAKNLPFFCKMEHKIEKNSNIALRFRLGDLNYVNMLENKTSH